MSKKRRSKRSQRARKKQGKRPGQPKEGEVVVHCGHLDTETLHYWHLGGPQPFRRPDGSEGESEWLAACEACFLLSKGQAGNIDVRDDGVWGGKRLNLTKPFGHVEQTVPLGLRRPFAAGPGSL